MFKIYISNYLSKFFIVSIEKILQSQFQFKMFIIEFDSIIKQCPFVSLAGPVKKFYLMILRHLLHINIYEKII